MIPIRQMLIVLLAFGLMASRTGMANQTETVLEVAVGTLNWDKGKPVGTAVIVVSRPIPDSPYGPRGSYVTLRGPRTWNEGKPVGLRPRGHKTWNFPVIVFGGNSGRTGRRPRSEGRRVRKSVGHGGWRR